MATIDRVEIYVITLQRDAKPKLSKAASISHYSSLLGPSHQAVEMMIELFILIAKVIVLV
jgi:hypothetical protein